MTGMQSIKQGESLPFEFDLGGADITNWTCTIEVKQQPEDTSAITPRVIQPEGRSWPGYLTSDETAAIDPSAKIPWQLIGYLKNTTDNLESQEPIRFNVTRAWV